MIAPLFVALAWAALIAVLVLRMLRQYRCFEEVGPHSASIADDAPRLAVIVPARNEAKRIGRCLDALLKQDYLPSRLRIIVVDDDSSDDTATIVQAVVADAGGATLLRAPPLPQGWMGKPHACQAGANSAGTEWLCFMDADTQAEPELLGTAIAVARARKLDMLSLEPFQVLGSFWERVIIPVGYVLVAFFLDPARNNDPEDPQAAANGQFILIRREVYESVGGHAAVRDAITEDFALARRVKRAGYRLAMLGGSRLIRTRMYTGLGEIWRGLSKNVPDIVGGLGRTVLLALAAVVMAVVSVGLPAWTVPLAISEPAPILVAAAVFSVLGTAALIGFHIGAVRHLQLPAWYGLLFPLGYVIGTALALHAIWWRARGHVLWKDRAYTTVPVTSDSQDPTGPSGKVP